MPPPSSLMEAFMKIRAEFKNSKNEVIGVCEKEQTTMLIDACKVALPEMLTEHFDWNFSTDEWKSVEITITR